MSDYARILVVEDDPGWIETLRYILSPLAEQLDFASNLTTAKRLAGERYYNVTIVDWSLELEDGSDEQGLDFLAHLRETGLDQAISCIVCSAYGDLARARKAFAQYDVVDFIDKTRFDEATLLANVHAALKRIGLDKAVTFQISRRRRLADLWQPFNWPRREDPAQLEPELRDLLIRLFPEVDHLFIDDMAAGQSGAGVLQVTPTYERQLGSPAVVKFGKRDKIHTERENYDKHVARFASSQSATQVNSVSGRVMAAIAYSLIGTALDKTESFKAFYAAQSPEAVCAVLDHLFTVAGRRWYDNRENPRMENVVDLYAQTFHLRWDEVWRFAEETGVDLSRPELLFPGLPQPYLNPKHWLAARDYEIYLETSTSVVHGDMNEANILVTPNGDSWLIDFYRTGPGHVLTDAVELETALKFNLAPVDSLQEHAALEERLLQQTRIDQLDLPPEDDPLYTTLAVIGHLRDLSDNLTGTDKGMTQYNLGLLMAALAVLGIEAFTDQRTQALLSAAMLCTKLEQGGL